MDKIPAVAIVGPTASGKTGLAVELALKFGGEVISADSMQIYEGLDIASAKPTGEEMRGVRHHMMGVVPVDSDFSVADYCAAAAECISDVHSRGKLPIVAGGTGLYVDTLLDNIRLSEAPVSPELRRSLMLRAETSGADELLSEVAAADPEYAAKLHPNDVKRIVRALELMHTTGMTMTQQYIASRASSPYNTLYIGLDAEDRGFLYQRINSRVDVMLENGLEDEAREYLSYGYSGTSSQAIGYKELKPFIDGEMSRDEAVERLKRSTRNYAKRQLTWFRRNRRINWRYIDKYQRKEQLFEEAFALTEAFLSGNQ
ncbi:MAG: tRNA (adenosine(37)-N6)-dimethylallyltransferase MiaA [Clostridia bacterium]|nr:tRNA (adenosine(37)-N6)-dimethylallyltransferase MiaA [Clostridia bacterium]